MSSIMHHLPLMRTWKYSRRDDRRKYWIPSKSVRNLSKQDVVRRYPPVSPHFANLLSIFLSIHKLIVRVITQRVWINVLIDILAVRNRLCANIGFVDYVKRMMTVSSFTCTIWLNCHRVISLVHSGNATIRNVYSFIYGLKNKQESVRGTHEDFAKRDPNVLINTFGEWFVIII